MIKILGVILKSIFFLLVLMVLNPHRVLLIPLQMIAAVLSWLAWRLEDFASWLDKGVKYGRKNFWLISSSVSDKLQKQIGEIDKELIKRKKMKDGSS